MIRKFIAVGWALAALSIAYVILEHYHAPLWVSFPVGAVSGVFALITYLMKEG